MIVFLVGAQKNVGDYLIYARARALFEHLLDEEYLVVSRFNKLDERIDELNNAKCIILCGGPAYRFNIYNGVYKLVDDLSKITVPIIPFGLGWSGKPADKLNSFKFDNKSLVFLNDIHKTILNSSCRDVLTKKILENNGIENVIMTGCPVWYHIDSLNKDFIINPIKKIVFTTPAKPKLLLQTLKLFRISVKKFPDAKFYFSFHRGILPDKKTSFKKGVSYSLMAIGAKLIKWNTKVIDVSYNLEKIAFYSKCDLHIGYRVHAHLDFLSKRLPSILINEDGRGLGMVKSMGLPELNIWDKDLISKFEKTLDIYIAENFKSLKSLKTFLDNKYETMKKFIINIGE